MQILQKQGFQVSPETAQSVQTRGKLKGIQQMSQAADAAENLSMGGLPEGTLPQPSGNGNGYKGPETSMSKGVNP
jgi:hypothetical protein